MAIARLGESRLGTGLQTAVQTDFFRYFYLRLSRQDETPDGHVLTFAPTAPQFRERVTVQASVDPAGHFQELQLRLDRTVIDDESTEAMARDIVKSFIQDATPLADVNALSGWVVDIASRHDAGSGRLEKGDLSEDDLFALLKSQLDAGRPVAVNLGPPGAARSTPGPTPSPAFEVFTGQREACEERLSSCVLRVANAVSDERTQLVVTIEALAGA